MVNGVSNTQSLQWYNLINNSKKTSGTGSGEDFFSFGSDSQSISGAKRPDPVQDLVDNGTITEDQAEAIDKAMKTAIEEGVGAAGQNPLSSLISSGTITQDQADAVKSALDASRPQEMSPVSSVLSSLVSDGTLTQDQADAVDSALKNSKPQGAPPPPPPSSSESSSSSSSSSDSTTDLSGMTEDQILQLLSEGKITAAQAQKALEQLKSSSEDSSSGSSSGVSAVNNRNDADPLDALISNGTITSDQQEAIHTAFQNAMTAKMAAKAYSSQSVQA